MTNFTTIVAEARERAGNEAAVLARSARKLWRQCAVTVRWRDTIVPTDR